MRSLYAYEEMTDVRMLMYVVEIYWEKKRKTHQGRLIYFMFLFITYSSSLLSVTTEISSSSAPSKAALCLHARPEALQPPGGAAVPLHKNP